MRRSQATRLIEPLSNECDSCPKVPSSSHASTDSPHADDGRWEDGSYKELPSHVFTSPHEVHCRRSVEDWISQRDVVGARGDRQNNASRSTRDFRQTRPPRDAGLHRRQVQAASAKNGRHARLTQYGRSVLSSVAKAAEVTLGNCSRARQRLISILRGLLAICRISGRDRSTCSE